jgi:hypothetical protein
MLEDALPKRPENRQPRVDGAAIAGTLTEIAMRIPHATRDADRLALIGIACDVSPIRQNALEWEITRLRSALGNWGRHHEWCLSLRNANLPEPCNCGLAQAIADSSDHQRPATGDG